MTFKDIVIFDIDGTLANGEHRQHHVRGPKKNWMAYMDGLAEDTVHEHVRAAFRCFKNNPGIDYHIYLLSGRDEPYREATEKWLLDNDIFGYHELYMRPANDYRPDDIIKEELFNKHFGEFKDRVLCVFDDRPRVIRMWRKIGIPIFNCGDGTEF